MINRRIALTGMIATAGATLSACAAAQNNSASPAASSASPSPSPSLSSPASASPTAEATMQATAEATAQASASTTAARIPADTSRIVTEELHAAGPHGDIYGYVTAPVNFRDTQLPVVIFSHGFNGRAESVRDWANAMAATGCVVYSFDFMGGNPSSRSGNNILAMSPFTEKDDLNAVLAMIVQQPFTDTSRVFLMGQSQGGVVSTMVAEENNDKIAGLILVYPAFVLFDDARALFSSVDQVPAVYNHRGNNVGRVYFEKSLDYDPYADMPKVSKPVLIVHGDADQIAPLRYSQRAVSTFKDARLEVISGASHFFNAAQTAQSNQYITAFLNQHIR
ncbi:MAG: alpha/beta fold hydrolase [Rothia sp. (in: high G+C Gram-positive bacteria)]|uniref:alpha/beta hydrolase family protein n=1 Tax=Rothia sp. (in: high G+C Gram-positive bacteria) TaxID=1885016 RepID=UPI0026DEDC8D|nr:alpha/beta fold hydrolase [Rothia sp. (in: high G+C Gram-positive bacteria)]MDO5751051.1 alpha/beta fold hydrolase [Rothia sp. (in: high G+C Gram-positive bacteria)]